MFNSLATFLFGAQATSEPSDNPEANTVQQNPNDPAVNERDVIEVTSSTPSVAGNNRGGATVRSSGNGKRGGVGAKQRRARQRQQQQQQQQQSGQRKQAPSITKLLTPGGSVLEEDFDEDEWYIVEEQDVEKDSLPRSDSEEETPELSVVELPAAAAAAAKPGTASGPSYRRRQLHLQHSLYSGPRPQHQHQHRNHQRSRQLCGPLLTMSALSPPRIVPINPMAGDDDDADSNQSISQSLYAPPSALSPCSSESSSSSGGSSTGHGSVVLMEESWYVTPPPCFTSIGPINMEASPFENLLIEHPSMSVYHSIRSSQAGSESFVNLDLGADSVAASELPAREPEPLSPEELATLERRRRATSARFDRHAAAESKKVELARKSQMLKCQQQHQQLCRTALTRANKVHAYQAKGQRPRRSDMQHCKLQSGANNNRKSC